MIAITCRSWIGSASGLAVVWFVLAVNLASCSLPPRSPLDLADRALVASGEQINRLKETEFVAYDPAYRVRRARFGERLPALASKLASLQASGKDMICSTEIYLEAKWLYNYTADWPELDRQLARLTESLRHDDQTHSRSQSLGLGGSQNCYDQWFLGAEATFTALEEVYDAGRTPRYPVMRPHPIDTPQKLEAYLNSLLISDIAKTGRDNRAELGGLATLLSAAIFKQSLREFLENAFDPLPGKTGSASFRKLAAVWENFVSEWQDLETGYWGAWYRSNGHVYKTTDLSITYHIIAYREGRVSHWSRIIDTTLRISDDPYPYGWLHDGHLTNHNNYDVARILRYGWAHMTESQRRRAREGIHRMVTWTLNESLNPDGSLKIDPTFFSSLAADYYFGVSFLDVIGFWDRSKRFWTDVDFPDAANVCRRLRARLSDLQSRDYQAVVALKRLNDTCGSEMRGALEAPREADVRDRLVHLPRTPKGSRTMAAATHPDGCAEPELRPKRQSRQVLAR
jgi:hypothetical protein